METTNILEGTRAYMSKIQDVSNRDIQENYPTTWESGQAPTFEMTEGSKYFKIIRIQLQKSVFCFVEKATGNIYKAATWTRPAKHSRGNVFSDILPLTEASLYIRLKRRK